jgi:hypothetical protein
MSVCAQAILEFFLACNAGNRLVLATMVGGQVLTARVCGLFGECMHAGISHGATLSRLLVPSRKRTVPLRGSVDAGWVRRTRLPPL